MNSVTRYVELAHGISDGSLSFPTSVNAALKIQRQLDDPNCSGEQAARLIQGEPLLAAKVISTANSVAYNPLGREITDLRQAVSRLGFQTLRTLTLAVITRQMASTSSPESQRMVNQLWEHTAYVASLAHLLAKRVTRTDPEAALFLGIIHEIGGFYLLSQAARQPDLIPGSDDGWVDAGEIAVGRAILRQLNVPTPILEAVEVSWEGYLSMPPVTLGDTLLLADALAPVHSPLHEPGANSLSEEMRSQIDMIIGQETLSEILKEAVDEVRSLSEALN